MADDFYERSLTGARFHNVDLAEASFERVSFRGAQFRDVDLRGVRIRGAMLQDVEVGGELDGLRVNGIDVGPLIENELDRRHPERVKLRPTDAAGFREAWEIIERLWAETVGRAEQLDEALLHERVDDEWSFIETLRHLVFATDAWVRRGILGDPSPWHPLDLPWDEMPSDLKGIPRHRDARPSLKEVLALRADRMATVRSYVADLTDEKLAGSTEPIPGPSWPPSESFPIQEVLSIILNEEWWHRQFAERDLAVLARR